MNNFFETDIKSLEEVLQSYQNIVDKGVVLGMISSIKKEIAAYKRIKRLLDESKLEPMWIVTVEQPYTSCCEAGRMDRTETFFKTEKLAKEYFNFKKKIGEKFVTIDKVQVIG